MKKSILLQTILFVSIPFGLLATYTLLKTPSEDALISQETRLFYSASNKFPKNNPTQLETPTGPVISTPVEQNVFANQLRAFLPFLSQYIVPRVTPGVDPTPSPIPTDVPAAGVFYVSPDGNDANPGTQAQPWRTIQKAATTLTAGQTVMFRNGVYSEKLAPQNSGSPDQYITYMAYPGETPVIDGTGVTLNLSDYRGDGLITIVGKSFIKVSGLSIKNSSRNCVNLYKYGENSHNDYAENIILSNLTIQNCQSNGIWSKFSRHILIENSSIDKVDYFSGIGIWVSEDVVVRNNTLTNCHYYHELQGADEEVLSISDVNTFEVYGNVLDFTLPNPYPSYTENPAYFYDRLGICLKDASTNGKVYKNTVRNMSAAGIYVDPEASAMLSHIDVYQNTTENTQGILVGAEVTGGSVEYVNIYNNLVLDSRFAGIHVTGAHGNGLRKNIKIYNNTIYGGMSVSDINGGAGIFVSTSNLLSNNSDMPLIIKNNIVAFNYYPGGGGCTGQIVAKTRGIADLVTADHNLVYGTYCLNYLPTWCTDCREIGPRTVASPADTFIDAANRNFHLKNTSPAIDIGWIIDFIFDDFDGLPRPQRNGFDVGAFEFQ